MQREVEIEAAGVPTGGTLWVEDLPAHDPATAAAPFLLVADGDCSALSWPDPLVERLRSAHRVVRYDHRDTGRSTRSPEEPCYALTDLAADALAVLDACGIGRAHVVGAGLGGCLVQLLLLDAPERLLSAALLTTTALDAHRVALPGPARDVQRMWMERHDPRDEAGELAWRVEYLRRLHGPAPEFDEESATEQVRRELAHSGRTEPDTAHGLADPEGLDRGDELPGVTVPTLLVEGPADPVYPPPHTAYLAQRIGPAARAVAIEGMGHVPGPAVLEPLARLLLDHAAGRPEHDEPAQPAQR